MVSTIILSFVFIVLSLTVNVNSQTCANTYQYASCSSNSECGCLPYSSTATMGVCGLLSVSCSGLVSCQSPNDVCASGYACVLHSRCDALPLCYPLSMADENSCPTIRVSNYSSALTVNSGNFSREASGSVFYYEAIEVRVTTTGTYTFTSSSAVIADTYGYLYQGNFYPSYPTYNVVVRDDDAGDGNQFQLTATLRSDVTYIVVFTTYAQRATGSFSIVASGPGDIFLNPINISM